MDKIDGGRRRLYVETYGCQMNVADSEVIASVAALAGYDMADDVADADAVMLNTCSIRDNAEQRVGARLRALAAERRKRLAAGGRRMLIGVAGCMAERLGQKLVADYGVDFVVGPDAYLDLPSLLAAAEQGLPAVNVELSTTETYREVIPARIPGQKISGFVSIMRGCDNFCSYCIVPYTRGRERSRPLASVLAEVADLRAKGYREVTLLGQNVNSYNDAESGTGFADLLIAVADAAPDMRVRFTTSHPKDMSDAIIAAMASRPNICRHIHLPVQSGSDRVLVAMNRKYDTARYRELIAYARKKIPDAVFTSDLIVGFPGETYEEFLETLALIKEVRYSALFTFIYSRREGTKAAELPDPVPYEEKSAWLRELLAAQEEISMGINTALIGSTCTVLAEEKSQKPGRLLGRNEGNIITEFPGDESLIGQFVKVKVTAAHNWAVEGELV